MNKRERIERTLADEPTDRTPSAAWRHFPGDDQRSLDYAAAAIHFQRTFDWDVVVVAPANSYMVADYGAFDEWQGGVDGTRVFTRRAVQRTLDWTALRPVDPARGSYARVGEAIRLIQEAVTDNTPVIVTVYSPLAQAADLAGNSGFIRHMRTQPDRLHTGLNTLAESTLRWLEALRRIPIAGIQYVLTGADYGVMSEEEYSSIGFAYDRKIIDSIPSKFWFNMLSFAGDQPMFKFANSFKVQSVHWHDRVADPNLTMGKSLFNGAACGGVSLHEMTYGTPNTLRDAARDAIIQMNGRRLILAPGGSVPVVTPYSHFRALREAVERSA